MKFAEMSIVLLKNDVITTSDKICTDCYDPSILDIQDAGDDC